MGALLIFAQSKTKRKIGDFFRLEAKKYISQIGAPRVRCSYSLKGYKRQKAKTKRKIGYFFRLEAKNIYKPNRRT
jgi:hypothetical protein